jgi:hypothetical protein
VLARRLAVVVTVALASTVLAGAAAAPGHAATKPTWRKLAATATFHIQFAGKLDTRIGAKVFEIDGQNASKATVTRLHKSGRKVICYLSAGSVESYRPDARAVPKSVIGKTLDGWPDERWLDVRRTSVLLPIMAKRVADCARKKFDAVEFDNVDGFANDTGFPITAAQQVRYDQALAALAHRHGMAAVLKNAPALVPALVRHFDGALVEQCAQYDECGAWTPFVRARKPVWDLEYAVPHARACAAGRAAGIQVQRKHLNLDAYRRPC